MTLIELMIVVAIVAILGSLAVASYRGYVLRSNRSEATSALLRIQAAQEKYYLNANTYTTNLTLLGLTASTERGLYAITVPNADANGYTARATATGSQVADASACGTLSITETGVRTPDPGTTECWR
jgi:type IV pilus assembly protein PilE